MTATTRTQHATAPAVALERPRARGIGARGLAVAALPAVLALLVAVVLSLLVGARTVAPDVAWQSVLHYDPTIADHAVVRSRLQRTATGIAVGAALAAAGAALQGMTRNPLADPGILGLNAGASAVVALGLFLGVISGVGQLMGAGFLGAALAACIVYSIASLGREGATPVKLALAGAAITAGFTSVVSALIMLDSGTLDRMRMWQVGVLGARDLADVAVVAIPLLIGLVVTVCCGRGLNALALGDDAATGLGVHVGRLRIVLGIAVVLLCGGAVALAGPIGFLGLVVPHAVRLLVGSDYRRLLPLSLLTGPALLLLADVIGRVIAPPAEVQVGVMTAIIGVPVFLALIRLRRRTAL